MLKHYIRRRQMPEMRLRHIVGIAALIGADEYFIFHYRRYVFIDKILNAWRQLSISLTHHISTVKSDRDRVLR